MAVVMVAQAISGIAKGLNKMGAKSAIRTVVPETPDDRSRGQVRLFRWVAILTGSKNALQGVGFFLFGARDVWFVVALPVFLQATLGWCTWEGGGFMGLWVIGYGMVQASAPALRRSWGSGRPPGPAAVQFWAAVLTAIPALIAVTLWRQVAHPGMAVVAGLAVFAVVFAMNSSIHSYMVLAYAGSERVSLDVGFYIHGQRCRSPAEHPALGCPVPRRRPAGLPVVLGAAGVGVSPAAPEAMTTLGVTFLGATIRVLGGSAVVWLATRLAARLLGRLTARTASGTDDALLQLVLGTAAPLGYLAMLWWGWQTLINGWGGTLPFDDRFVSGALLLVAIVLIVRLTNRSLLLLIKRSMRRLGREQQMATLDGLAPMLRTIVWIIGALVFLQNQGVALGAVYASLAGAGIGIGLALKGPFTSFISYLTILLDEPFRIGDVIRFGDALGTVERVGLRSSVIRSLSGERIVISNEELLNQTIRNFGDLPRRRVAHRIGVLYDTPVETVAAIPDLVAAAVRAHPPAEFDRCHLTAFAATALEVEFVFFVPDGDMVLFLDLQQKIHLDILRSFEAQGIGFAHPTQTPYLERQEAERQRAAEPARPNSGHSPQRS